MFLRVCTIFMLLNGVVITLKMSRRICKNTNWDCDNTTVATTDTDYCIGGRNCISYWYCVSNKWCEYHNKFEDKLDKTKTIDLVIIDNAKFIPKCLIRNLPKLKTIYGPNKDIAFVEPWAFWNVPELEEINLSYNFIIFIEYGTFSLLSSLRKLDLSWNEIRFIRQSSFQGLNKLKYLDLSGNYITEFDASYHFSVQDTSMKLKDLRLSHNELQKVYNLNRFLDLDHLDLSHNKIAEFNASNNFFPYQSLSEIDFTDNALTQLYIDAPEMYINKLRISFNDFKHPSSINILGRVRVIAVDGNPWMCEIYSQLLSKFIKLTILSAEEDEEVYFLTQTERSNYPTCWMSNDKFESAPPKELLVLRSNYKKIKNPECKTATDCPDEMICKNSRCWNPCQQNVCDKTALCFSSFHGFSCSCFKGALSNPRTVGTACHEVECFRDSDCPSEDLWCRLETHKCELYIDL